VKPADISLLRVPGRPAIAGDGSILVATSAPDPVTNIYRGTLARFHPGRSGAEPAMFTQGPRDSEPVVGPDGSQLVFLRAPESGPGQLHLMPVDGGEPRKLTDHPLGAGSAVFSPDGRQIAYCAAVPEDGRYGTDEDVTADAEPPRRTRPLPSMGDCSTCAAPESTS
jgi:Tol biopolymer transport system component